MEHNYSSKDEAFQEMKARLFQELKVDFIDPSKFLAFDIYRFFLTTKYFTPNMESKHERAVILEAIEKVSEQVFYKKHHQGVINEYEKQIESYDIADQKKPAWTNPREFQNIDIGDQTNALQEGLLNKAYDSAMYAVEENNNMPDIEKMNKLDAINEAKAKQLAVMEDRQRKQQPPAGETNINTTGEGGENARWYSLSKPNREKKYQKPESQRLYQIVAPVFHAKKEETKTEQEPLCSSEKQQPASIAKKPHRRREARKIYESSSEKINNSQTKKEESLGKK